MEPAIPVPPDLPANGDSGAGFECGVTVFSKNMPEAVAAVS